MRESGLDGSPAFPDLADDGPEFTDAMFDQGELRHGDVVTRAYRGPGRPKTSNPKPQVTIRLERIQSQSK